MLIYILHTRNNTNGSFASSWAFARTTTQLSKLWSCSQREFSMVKHLLHIRIINQNQELFYPSSPQRISRTIFIWKYVIQCVLFNNTYNGICDLYSHLLYCVYLTYLLFKRFWWDSSIVNSFMHLNWQDNCQNLQCMPWRRTLIQPDTCRNRFKLMKTPVTFHSNWMNGINDCVYGSIK